MSGAPFAYAITTIILCLNLMLLWLASGGARAKTNTVRNPEDPKVVKSASVVDADPEAVARVLRAHQNTLVNTVPFLFVGQLYIAANPGATMAWIFFGAFTAARVIYSFVYLNGIQPWRTIMFGIGVLAFFSMTIHLLVLMFT